MRVKKWEIRRMGKRQVKVLSLQWLLEKVGK